MGGEKLNTRQNKFAAALLYAAIFLLISFPITAQDSPQDLPASEAREGDPQSAAPEILPPEETQSGFPGEESIVLSEDAPAAVGGGVSSVWAVLRMVLALALAALAIYGVVFFIKRLAKPPQNRDPHLKILASVPLGSGAFAAVLSVGSKAWLVGGGDGGVNLISEIEEQEALEAMLIDGARKDTELEAGRLGDFRSLLRKFTGKGRVSSGPGGANLFDSHAESLRKQRDRLKGL